MASPEQLKALLAQLADAGFNMGDINRELKTMKQEGKIKAARRGKAVSDDPARVPVRELLLKAAINGSSLLDYINKQAEDSTSYMVTLDDKWSINFVKRVAKPKKDKTTQPEGFAEPTVS